MKKILDYWTCGDWPRVIKRHQNRWTDLPKSLGSRVLSDHLLHKTIYGAYPGQRCRFLCYDIDSGLSDNITFLRVEYAVVWAEENDIKIMISRSPSKGAHIYIFLDAPLSIDQGNALARALGPNIFRDSWQNGKEIDIYPQHKGLRFPAGKGQRLIQTSNLREYELPDVEILPHYLEAPNYTKDLIQIAGIDLDKVPAVIAPRQSKRRQTSRSTASTLIIDPSKLIEPCPTTARGSQFVDHVNAMINQGKIVRGSTGAFDTVRQCVGLLTARGCGRQQILTTMGTWAQLVSNDPNTVGELLGLIVGRIEVYAQRLYKSTGTDPRREIKQLLTPHTISKIVESLPRRMQGCAEGWLDHIRWNVMASDHFIKNQYPGQITIAGKRKRLYQGTRDTLIDSGYLFRYQNHSVEAKQAAKYALNFYFARKELAGLDLVQPPRHSEKEVLELCLTA